MVDNEDFDFYELEEYWTRDAWDGDWDVCGQVKTLQEAEDWIAEKPKNKRRYVGKNFMTKSLKW